MKHMARYYYPGFLFSEESTRVLDLRDPQLAVQMAPESAFCFVLYDIEEAPDLGPDFAVTPKPKNESGRYYIGGRLYTIDEVRAMNLQGDYTILISNMESNHWDYVIQTRSGNWQPFTSDDSIVAG